MRLCLRRGGWIAAAGALLILFGGTFLPLDALKIWGIPLFFGGLILISIGWLPYRELQKLERTPHRLHYDGECLYFEKGGKPLFKIPEKSVEKLAYVEKEALYGIAIWLKKPIVEKVRVLQVHFNLEGFIADSATRCEGCDLFLPYFTKGATAELIDLLESDRAS